MTLTTEESNATGATPTRVPRPCRVYKTDDDPDEQGLPHGRNRGVLDFPLVGTPPIPTKNEFKQH